MITIIFLFDNKSSNTFTDLHRFHGSPLYQYLGPRYINNIMLMSFCRKILLEPRVILNLEPDLIRECHMQIASNLFMKGKTSLFQKCLSKTYVQVYVVPNFHSTRFLNGTLISCIIKALDAHV